MCEKRTLPRWCKDVKHQLIERDMDVNDLAEAIGISRVYVSEIINGRRCAPEMAKKIASFLEVETAYQVITP